MLLIIVALGSLVLAGGGGVLNHAFNLIGQNERAIKITDLKVGVVKDDLGGIRESMMQIRTLQSEIRDDLKELKRFRLNP